MEILIFSDSHGSASNMSLALDRQIKTPDAILFLGDGARDLDNLFVVDTPIWAVRGNCDWYSSDLADKTERLLYFEGHTILLCHGHEWGVKGGLGALIAHAAEIDADIVLFGHTHTRTLEYIEKGSIRGVDRDIVLFNPGSLGDFEGSFGNLNISDSGFLLSHGNYHNIIKK